MAAPPARARADYDYLIKLLLIGDSGQFIGGPISPSISSLDLREICWRRGLGVMLCILRNLESRLGSGSKIDFC
jgi:hypothetical protein